MADPTPETPIINTRRPNLRERAAQMDRRRYRGGVWSFLGFLFRAVTLVAVVLGGVYLYQHVLTKPGEPARAPEAGTHARTTGSAPVAPAAVSPAPVPPKPEPEDLEASQRKMEFETAQGIQRQQLALAKLKQRQVIDLGRSVVKALDEWKTELDRWDIDVATLLEGDAGKPLAANKTLLKRFRAVYELERPGRDEEERLRSETDGVVSAVKLATDNPSDGSLPPEAASIELRGLLQDAKNARDQYRTSREQIASLVRQAKAGGAAGAKPLEEAAREQQDEERLAAAAVIEAERARAEQEATQRLAKAKADQVREVGEKQERVVRANTEVLKVQKERERIRNLAGDPAVQAQFAPFLADGRYQFEFGVFGPVPEPASYKKLLNVGILNDSTTFAHAMAGESMLGPLTSRVDNDRPHGSFPSTQAQMRRMEQLFELFKELAPTWIEMGKLKP